MTEKTEIAVMTHYELQRLVEASVRRVFEELLDLTLINESRLRPEKKRYVYGLRGIAELFNCSIPTACRIKRSGRISHAVTQIGRKIIVDAEMALELAGKKVGGRQ